MLMNIFGLGPALLWSHQYDVIDPKRPISLIFFFYYRFIGLRAMIYADWKRFNGL